MIKLPAQYDALDWQERRAVREEYARLQEGNCHYCGNPLDGPPTRRALAKRVSRHRFPPNFFNHPIHLHHSHKTGLTIGAVHNHCNAVLWQYHGE